MLKKLSLLDYIKILVYGIVFAIIAYLLTGDTSSFVIGLLVMYLEYRFSDKVSKK
jgi:hypothetical protein